MLPGLREQRVHDQGGGVGVQVAGGLVGQQQGRAVYQRAGNGYALQLPVARPPPVGACQPVASQRFGALAKDRRTLAWRANSLANDLPI